MEKIRTLLISSTLILCIALSFPSGDNNFAGKAEEQINKAYGVGEELVYDLNWEFINAGVASLQVVGITELRTEKCYHIRSTANSNKTISYLYNVKDLVESFIHVKKLHSLRFEKHLQEGNYRADKFVIFDQERHIAIYPNDTVDIPIDAQDVLSALYFVRTLDLEVGDTIPVPNHTDKKNYPLDVIVHCQETVEVPCGKFDCIMVEPILKTPGLFKQEGRVEVWLTNDEHKMPVLMRSRVLVGAIEASLCSYKYGEPFQEASEF